MSLIIVNGRLGSRPESKSSKSGTAYLSFSVAHSEKKGQNEETTWYKCIWMNGNNSGISSYLDKGSLVTIVGKLQKPKIFQKKDGSNDIDLIIFVSDVSFLPVSKPAENVQGPSVYAPQKGEAKTQEFVQDEMPF